MAGLTQHDVLVAVVGAVIGAVIASIPVWITVSQVRRSRLKAEVSDAVDAKVGALVGTAFANLLKLQRDAEQTLLTLKSDLESQAKHTKEVVQTELQSILLDARNTMRDLQIVAANARESATEIDTIRATSAAYGVDYDQLLVEAEARAETDALKRRVEGRRSEVEALEILLAARDPQADIDREQVEALVARYRADDPEHAAGIVALEIRKSDDIIDHMKKKIVARAATAARINAEGNGSSEDVECEATPSGSP